MSSSKVIQLREFECLFAGSKENERNGFKAIDLADFYRLEEFVRKNRKENSGELEELLTLTYRKGWGDCIQARNYVGVIAMCDGTTIEILPKLKLGDSDETGERERKLFLRMLAALLRIPMRSSGNANLKLASMGIFETFIRMFIDEAEALVKKGLKSDYIAVEENIGVLKGKLVFPENVRVNAAHKERFYVKHDEYSLNRPENKVIKETLLLLSRVTHSDANKRALRRLLGAFVDVRSPKDAEVELAKCRVDRNTSDYELLLDWCEVFLKGKSFSTFQGSEVSMALLFPMEKVFEAYVYKQLRKKMQGICKVSAQKASKHLYEKPAKGLLRPDILCEWPGDEKPVVLDTKWKRLRSLNDISQSDLYQMYAYQKKFDARETVLVYPVSEELGRGKQGTFTAEGDVRLSVFMYDFADEEGSLDVLKALLTC